MNLQSGKNAVTFKSFGVDLYLPEGFDASKKYKAIVGASLFPQVKGQIPAIYGPEMAKRGFSILDSIILEWEIHRHYKENIKKPLQFVTV